MSVKNNIVKQLYEIFAALTIPLQSDKVNSHLDNGSNDGSVEQITGCSKESQKVNKRLFIFILYFLQLSWDKLALKIEKFLNFRCFGMINRVMVLI